MWAYFTKKSIENLKVALSMTPGGDILRNRCRSYPGLVNSTTIDWMFAWPQDALISVADFIIIDVKFILFNIS